MVFVCLSFCLSYLLRDRWQVGSRRKGISCVLLFMRGRNDDETTFHRTSTCTRWLNHRILLMYNQTRPIRESWWQFRKVEEKKRQLTDYFYICPCILFAIHERNKQRTISTSNIPAVLFMTTKWSLFLLLPLLPTLPYHHSHYYDFYHFTSLRSYQYYHHWVTTIVPQ